MRIENKTVFLELHFLLNVISSKSTLQITVACVNMLRYDQNDTI